jgi:hypothetical protein
MKSCYVCYNANPKHKTVDCAIRAVAKAAGLSWLDAFDGLCAVARRRYSVPNDWGVCQRYLATLGFVRGDAPKIAKGSHRPTVRSFAEAHPSGAYVLRVANHLTCVVDGKYYDLWDCGNRAVYGYYGKAGE